MMKRDLKVAREKWIKEADNPDEQAERAKTDFLTYRNQEGLFADFHSNRHTFISNLSRAGVHPKLAQTLARHSTINLTMNVYTHMGMDEKARAVASIPGPLNGRENGHRQQTIGQNGGGAQAAVVPSVVPCGAQDGALQTTRNGSGLASNGNDEAEPSDEDEPDESSHKLLEDKRFGLERHDLATNATVVEERRIEVRPEGLEPPTLGSED
jgi:hypothetical protein